MKYIEGFCFFPHFYFHSVESVNARAMILIIDLSGEKEEKGKRKKGRRREREKQEIAICPNENAKIHGGSRDDL